MRPSLLCPSSPCGSKVEASSCEVGWLLFRPLLSTAISLYAHCYHEFQCRTRSAYVPSRLYRRLKLRLLHSKLTQVGHFSGLAMVTWPFARTLHTSLARHRIQGTMLALAFCFRRWHSVHEVVAPFSFWVCIAVGRGNRRYRRCLDQRRTVSRSTQEDPWGVLA